MVCIMRFQVLQLCCIRRYSANTWSIHIPLGFVMKQQQHNLQLTTYHFCFALNLCLCQFWLLSNLSLLANLSLFIAYLSYWE